MDNLAAIRDRDAEWMDVGDPSTDDPTPLHVGPTEHGSAVAVLWHGGPSHIARSCYADAVRDRRWLLALLTPERLAAALHDECVAEWRLIAMRDPDRMVTQHMADAHRNDAEAIIAALATQGAHITSAPEPADLRGLAPGITGGMSSEDYVRSIRDDPVSAQAAPDTDDIDGGVSISMAGEPYWSEPNPAALDARLIREAPLLRDAYVAYIAVHPEVKQAAVRAALEGLRADCAEPKKPYYPDAALNDAYLRGLARARVRIDARLADLT